MSTVCPVEVEEIAEVEDMFLPWMATVTRLLEMLQDPQFVIKFP